jgi:leucyl-tRNA synthetase
VELSPMIERWGADSIRMTMMFAGPVDADVDWAKVSVSGVHKWLGRVWRSVHEAVAPRSANQAEGSVLDGELKRLTHRTVKAVTGDYERFVFNVGISRLMTLTSELQRAVQAGVPAEDAREAAEDLVLMLAPMAPHIAEELWAGALGHEGSLSRGPWPAWEEDLAREEEVVLVVQIDGRVRDRITVRATAGEDECREMALGSERIRRFLKGKAVDRIVVRAPRLVNLVTATAP